jgi:hypothetical protein
MQSDSQMTGRASELNVLIHALIHNNDHSVVYRASLDDHLAVVLKFSLDEDEGSNADLTKEANAYMTYLKPLQGSVIPTFYGKYQGTCSEHGTTISCIVLEDCGDEVSTEFHELPDAERRVSVYISPISMKLNRLRRYRILEQLGKFHAGSNHHPLDFAERNVVVKDGQYRLIDFHTLIEHECEFEGHWGFGEYFNTDFGCMLLAHVAIEFDAWKLGELFRSYSSLL